MRPTGSIGRAAVTRPRRLATRTRTTAAAADLAITLLEAPPRPTTEGDPGSRVPQRLKPASTGPEAASNGKRVHNGALEQGWLAWTTWMSTNTSTPCTSRTDETLLAESTDLLQESSDWRMTSSGGNLRFHFRYKP